jgi:alginate biosynthesis protein Alg44
LSGCSIKGLPDAILNKKYSIGDIYFKFDNFEIYLEDIPLEFLHRRADGNVGCKFIKLSPKHIAVFNQIISSSLRDEVVTERDIIKAIQRTAEFKSTNIRKDKKNRIGKIIFYIFALSVIVFLLSIFYKKVFILKVENAFVNADLYTVKAPRPSYVYYPINIFKGKKVKKDEILGLLYFLNGGVQKIVSLINGEIFKISAFDFDFRKTNEPILYILPYKKHSIYIKAHILHKNLIKLKLGYIANVLTPDGKEFYAKLVDILPAKTVFKEKTQSLWGNVYTSANNYDTLIFYTNYPLKNMINKTLIIHIDTFLNRIGWYKNFKEINDK